MASACFLCTDKKMGDLEVRKNMCARQSEIKRAGMCEQVRQRYRKKERKVSMFVRES